MITKRIISILRSNFNDYWDKWDTEQGLKDFFHNFFEDSSRKVEAFKQKDYENYRRIYEEYQRQEKFWQSPQSIISKKEKRYFDALEITPTNSFAEIKEAYKKVMKKYHPDKFHNKPEKQKYAQELTQIINDSYNYFKEKYEK